MKHWSYLKKFLLCRWEVVEGGKQMRGLFSTVFMFVKYITQELIRNLHHNMDAAHFAFVLSVYLSICLFVLNTNHSIHDYIHLSSLFCRLIYIYIVYTSKLTLRTKVSLRSNIKVRMEIIDLALVMDT